MKEFIPFTYEMLDKEHLSSIRELGRQIGVRSPSSLPKDELIDQIIRIQKGELSPVTASKRGAPPKIRVDISHFFREKTEERAEPKPDAQRGYRYRRAAVRGESTCPKGGAAYIRSWPAAPASWHRPSAPAT